MTQGALRGDGQPRAEGRRSGKCRRHPLCSIPLSLSLPVRDGRRPDRPAGRELPRDDAERSGERHPEAGRRHRRSGAGRGRLRAGLGRVDAPGACDDAAGRRGPDRRRGCRRGFGRTGQMFAFERAGIVPDVLVLSKAVGGGYPLAAVVYDQSLDVWPRGLHAGTFRGNQIAMVAGRITLQIIERDRLAENAALMGTRLMEGPARHRAPLPGARRCPRSRADGRRRSHRRRRGRSARAAGRRPRQGDQDGRLRAGAC